MSRINAAIKTQLAAGGLKSALLKKAVDAKLQNWRATGQVTHRIYDALVFRKVGMFSNDLVPVRSLMVSHQIRNLLGGNIKYISSGAAPLTPEVHEILKIAFSCEAVQGVSPPVSVVVDPELTLHQYGMTEVRLTVPDERSCNFR